MLKIAVFGCGYWADFQVAAWQEIGAQVVCVCDLSYERADLFAQKHGIEKVFCKPEEVFKWGEFDIADIIADINAHKDLVLMSAAYKKAVICQKPMAYNWDDCKQMVSACKKAGVWFAVHENFRYQPPTQEFIKAVRSGVIGKILHAQINMRSPDREIIKRQPALSNMPQMVLRDMGPHIFDVARAAFGEFKSIYARPIYSYRRHSINVPDAALCLLTTDNDVLVECNLVHDWNDRFTAYGENGKIVLTHENILHIYTADKTQTVDLRELPILKYIPSVDWNLHGAHTMHGIENCLNSLTQNFCADKEAETSGSDNLKTVGLVFSAIESFEKDAVIAIDKNESV